MSDLSATVKDSHKETLTLIDHAIRECAGRDLVSSGEMTDILLDIRLAYISAMEQAKL
jgi:hypothetical protein